MKRKTAKELMIDSFWELAETKPIDRITVGDITSNCGYSTATFYRHFRDKYDLIVRAYSQGVSAIMQRIGVEGYTWRQTLVDGARVFRDQREVLANLLLHTNGHDSFVRNMTEINYDALKGYILKISGQAALDEQTDMFVRLYCMGTVSLTCEWILGKYGVSPEALAAIYETALPAPLHPYLLQQ